MSADPDPFTLHPPDRRGNWLLRVLRTIPVVLVFVFLAGVGLTVYGFTNRPPARKDGFAILPERRNAHHLLQRVEVPPGWRLGFVRTKQAFVTGVFAPDGTFAFHVSVVPPQVYPDNGRWVETASTVDRFAELWGKQPNTTVERRATDGMNFAVARRPSPNSWVSKWDRAAGPEATELTFFAERRPWCLRFDIPTDRVARFEPDAERMFLSAEVVPADDPRADATDPEAVNERGYWWPKVVGVSLVVVAVGLFLLVAWLAVVVHVRLCVAGRLSPRRIPPPEPPKPLPGKPTPPDRVGEAEAALAGLGFQRVGWFALDDAEDLRVSAWWHPHQPAVAFVVTSGGAPRVRFVTRFDCLWLVTTSRRVELAYRPPAGVYLQMKQGTTGELWAWHREAEEVFAEHRVKPSPPSSDPMGVYVELRHRIARHHTSYTLWFLRYELCTELCRMWRWSGKSVLWQVERGRVRDPSTVWVGGLNGGRP